MRAAFALLLIAALGRADAEGGVVVDDILAALQKGDARAARDLAREALAAAGPQAEVKTLLGVADRLLETRRIQRARGYDAALDFLEGKIDHWVLAQAYGETARWAGQEQRGLEGLRASGLPLAERIAPELYLLATMQRFDEIVARARDARRRVDWEALDGWIEFGIREGRLRRDLAAHADRAARLALAALLVILSAWGLAWRLAPREGLSKGV